MFAVPFSTDFVFICDAFCGRFQVGEIRATGAKSIDRGDLISGQLDKKHPLTPFSLCRRPVTQDHLRPPDRSLDKSDRSWTSHLDRRLTSHLGRLDVLLDRS